MLNSSIRPIDKILSGATNPGQSEPRSNDIEEVLHIPQIYKAGASSSDGLMSYLGHLLVWQGRLTPLKRCSQQTEL